MGNNNEELEPIIEDGNMDYFNKTPEDYKGVVVSTINKILITNSKLLTNSGKIYIKVEGQFLQKEENTLKVYYQLIDFLEDLLLYYFDEQATKEINEQNELRVKIYDRYFNEFIRRQVSEARKYKYEKEGIIPQDDPLSKWCWEQIEEETKKIYRNKLRSLLQLYKRKNDLSGKRYATLGIQ